MKFSSLIALAALFVAGSATVSANHVERAHQLKARVHKENGIEKRGQGKMTWYAGGMLNACLLYTSPSPRDRQKSRMPSSA